MKNYEHVTNLSIYIHRSQSWYIWYFQYFIYFCFVAAYFISSFLKWYSTVSPENRDIILYPLFFQLLVDYFGIFVAFGRLRVIYSSCWQSIKYRNRFSIWPWEFLYCWYHRVWYFAWYYEQFIWVSLSLSVQVYDLKIARINIKMKVWILLATNYKKLWPVKSTRRTSGWIYKI